MRERLKLFWTIFDSRFEDLTRSNRWSILYRDFSAGLIVALTAIPMAMAFAMAMGLRPEQGIIAGAVACLIGRTFGGSKYQVYGPTAAFIPVIAGLMYAYGPATGGSFEQAHGFLVLVSVLAGVVLMAMGIFGLGRYAALVPDAIIVGFTIGIAVVIALASAGDAVGINLPLKAGLVEKLSRLASQVAAFNWYALGIALSTFVLIKVLLRVSIFIPAPLIAMGLATLASGTVLANAGIATIGSKFGGINTDNFFLLTGPVMPSWEVSVLLDVLYFVIAIVFVSAVESLLCSSMADRLADNRKTPFHPDKELHGQGMVQIITPLLNGFPCTGALARTATSIKAGAVTPLAGYFKGVLKIGIAFFMAAYLSWVPLACIAGILFWVASNMVKPAEIREVWHHGRFHAGIMVFTAIMVPLVGFLWGVLAAMAVYALTSPIFNRGPRPAADSGPKHVVAEGESVNGDRAPGSGVPRVATTRRTQQ